MKRYLILGLTLLAILKVLGGGYLPMTQLHLEGMLGVAADCSSHACDEGSMSQCLQHCLRAEPISTDNSSIPLPVASVVLFAAAFIFALPRFFQKYHRVFLFGSPPGLAFVRHTILRE